jgi:hypothetical protein
MSTEIEQEAYDINDKDVAWDLKCCRGVVRFPGLEGSCKGGPAGTWPEGPACSLNLARVGPLYTGRWTGSLLFGEVRIKT